MVRMMSIRDYDNIDLSPCTLFELFNAYLTDVQKEPKGWKYLCYKVKYRRQLKSESEKKWSNDLPDIELFLINVEQEPSTFQFDSDKIDFEKYIEKLLRMKKSLD